MKEQYNYTEATEFKNISVMNDKIIHKPEQDQSDSQLQKYIIVSQLPINSNSSNFRNLQSMNSANSSKIDFKNINNFAEDNRDK